MHCYQWAVSSREKNAKLYNVVRRGLPLMPQSMISSLFEKRDVKMNGIRCAANETVQPGSIIQVYSDFFPSLQTLYEDANVLVINKPAGLCVEDPFCGMSVLSILNADENTERVRLCHRLDSKTSGLMVLARNQSSETLLTDAFRLHQVHKQYQCLVRGQMRPAQAVCRAYLIKDAQAGKVHLTMHPAPNAREIVTEYETLSFDGTISRLLIRLITGRTHQIRAHMAYLNHPVLGDDLYGDRILNRKLGVTDLKLCSTQIRLIMPSESALHYLNEMVFQIKAPF